MGKDFVEELLKDIVDPTLALPDPSLVQYYKDLENRVIWLADEVDDDLLDMVSKIIDWNRDDKDTPIAKRKPIKIFFNSPGGSLDIEETIVSVIHLSKTPIYGFALGMVASAASLIYLSCHKRFALPNAYLIFHQGSCSNLSGSYSEVKAAMEDYVNTVEHMTQFYIENTSFTEEEIRKKIQSDWYIYMPEALEKGIVNEIVQDIKVMF